ncbi:amino acid ABC transporter permease [Bradyrhizobium sp. CCGUVB1N3]|uniref:amino acid ABC transporter permease n=1 Tax=Bradyrhizobium sp. CCGUVB1N3 TaxID=2949629 RepID=UPI0020B2369A|nr:amino acid ABC transporter permease [Bradyrhizobium sp. CCGUVB1N3]MCP3474861.1 amino acid ABC transporter permease [Bradyrhizobium sp. CCGUVB1N3]
MDWSQFGSFAARYLPQLWSGMLVTILVATLAAPTALAIGVLLTVPRVAGWRALSGLVRAYVEVMRNTPLLVQMYLLFFGLPILGIFWDEITCGVLAVALQHAAFLSELFRSGIGAVGNKQWEAGQAIGMRRWMTFRKIILPQAVIKVLAPVSNQLIVLVKDTSLVSAIGVLDLTLSGKVIIERSGASFEVFILVAALYLILTSVIGVGFRVGETRFARRLG